MLAFFRVIILTFVCFWIGIIGIIYSLFRPAHPNNVHVISRTFLTKLAFFIGLKVEYRYPNIDHDKNYVYICNHQSNFDLITLPGMIMPRTIGVGKKSLMWIPIFGIFFWITGNVFIDRKKTVKARQLLSKLADKMQQRNISIWLFPEGTRSKGRGILPFKMGAFHLASDTKSSIVPIVSSELNISLNRWNNGLVIVEMLKPIEIGSYPKENLSQLSQHVRELMINKYDELNVALQSKSINIIKTTDQKEN